MSGEQERQAPPGPPWPLLMPQLWPGVEGALVLPPPPPPPPPNTQKKKRNRPSEERPPGGWTKEHRDKWSVNNHKRAERRKVRVLNLAQRIAELQADVEELRLQTGLLELANSRLQNARATSAQTSGPRLVHARRARKAVKMKAGSALAASHVFFNASSAFKVAARNLPYKPSLRCHAILVKEKLVGYEAVPSAMRLHRA